MTSWAERVRSYPRTAIAAYPVETVHCHRCRFFAMAL